jgi:hypothetical protein
MVVKETKVRRIWIILLLCPLAAAANAGLSLLVQYKFHLSLFLDTLFNAAITFAAGLLPGISTAILTFVICALRSEPPETHFFAICSIAEIVLIWMFRRRFTKAWAPAPSAASGPVSYSLIAAASSLLILALIDCLVISVLGGVIDTAIFLLFSPPRNQFSPEGVFRLGLLRNGVPILWANILARFPINLVDRFIVVFGGRGVSLLIGKIYTRRPV